MPQFHVRNINDVPKPSRTAASVRRVQVMYDDFIKTILGIGSNMIGDIELDKNDGSVRSVKVRLRRASSRLGVRLQIWDVNDRVYFQEESRRGRRSAKRKSLVAVGATA